MAWYTLIEGLSILFCEFIAFIMNGLRKFAKKEEHEKNPMLFSVFLMMFFSLSSNATRRCHEICYHGNSHLISSLLFLIFVNLDSSFSHL